MADSQPLHPAAARPQLLGDPQHRLPFAGQHAGPGPVHGGQAHRLVGQRPQQLLLLGLHGHHRAAARQLVHQPAARGDQRAGVGQVKHPGGMGGGQLTDRVPDQQIRRHPPVPEQPEQRRLQGEKRRLGVPGAVQQLSPLAAGRGEQHLAQRQVEMRRQLAKYLVQRVGEDRLRLVEPGPGSGPLAALAGEEKGGAAPWADHTGGQPSAGPARGQGPQRGAQFAPVPAAHGGSVIERGPAHRQRVAQVRDVEVGPGVEVPAQPPGLGPQRRPAPGRQQ